MMLELKLPQVSSSRDFILKKDIHIQLEILHILYFNSYVIPVILTWYTELKSYANLFLPAR